jgi:hypothetical protein
MSEHLANIPHNHASFSNTYNYITSRYNPLLYQTVFALRSEVCTLNFKAELTIMFKNGIELTTLHFKHNVGLIFKIIIN